MKYLSKNTEKCNSVIYIDILIVMLLLQVLDGKFMLAIKYFQAIDDLLKYTRLNGFKSYY